MSSATRTGTAVSGRGMQFIKRQELYRIRRMQDISGPGVARSARGINISNTPQRPVHDVGAVSEYTGPWKAAIVTDGDTFIRVGTDNEPTGHSNDIFRLNGYIDAIVDPLDYYPNLEVPSAGSYQLSLDFQYQWAADDRAAGQRGEGGWNRLRTQLVATPNVGGSTSYPATPMGNRQYGPFDVSNNYLVPICRFTVDSDLIPTSIDQQLQYGPIAVKPTRTNIFYDSTNLNYYHGGNGSTLGTLNYIYIPPNSENQYVWADCGDTNIWLDFNDAGGNTRAVPIAIISVDGNGYCTKLVDLSASIWPLQVQYTDTLYSPI